METIAKVRRRYHLNKESVSRIARKMNLSRTTVRKYVERINRAGVLAPVPETPPTQLLLTVDRG